MVVALDVEVLMVVDDTWVEGSVVMMDVDADVLVVGFKVVVITVVVVGYSVGKNEISFQFTDS